MYANIIKDDFIKLSRIAAMGTATASVLLVGTIPPTFAAPLAPPCVTTGSVYTTYKGTIENIIVTNGCPYTVRVKVVLAYGADAACFTYRKNQSRRWWWPSVPRRFDRLERC